MSIDALIKEVESLNRNVCVEGAENYVRVKGKTYNVRAKLKLLGFQWNPNKREWYYSAKEINLNRNESGERTKFMA